MRRIVVLGGGEAGTLVANKLCERSARSAPGEVIITVIDRDGARVSRDRLFVVPFGVCAPADAVAPRGAGLHVDANCISSGIDRVDLDASEVVLRPGTRLPYDVLVVATGSRPRPDLTPGLAGCGWRERIFELGTLDGATALRRALESFSRGRLVIDAAEQPIGRPLNLLRFAMLARSYFAKRGLSDRVEIVFAAPLAGAFETRHASLAFTRMLAERGVTVVPEFRSVSVDGTRGVLRAANARELSFDLLVTLPVRAGASFVERSARLGDGRGFVRCDVRTRQAQSAPNVFAVGEARSVTGMSGGVSAGVEARVVSENVWRVLHGGSLIRGLEELSSGRVAELPAAVARARDGTAASPSIEGDAPTGALQAGPCPQTWSLRLAVDSGAEAPLAGVNADR